MNAGEAKPFLKWAGGKRQLLSEIQKYYPFEDEKYRKYAEPFVGGGAVLFDILNKWNLKEAYISDINKDLINAYTVVRDSVDELIEQLRIMQDGFISLPQLDRKLFYTNIQGLFNNLGIGINKNVDIEKAAMMIFLNKTCFNGLFRVNKQGMFNVPMGSYREPNICDEKNLLAASAKLQGVTIVCGDYHKSAEFIDGGTFAYFDPPYRPLTATANFTAYTNSSFGDIEQIKLAQFVDEMRMRGARIIVSNSDPHNYDAEDDFFDDIYSSYKIRRVPANRSINCNGRYRRGINELIISS